MRAMNNCAKRNSGRNIEMLKVLILATQLQVSPSVTLLCLPECVMPAPSERLYPEHILPEKSKKKNLEPKKSKKKDRKPAKVWSNHLRRNQS